MARKTFSRRRFTYGLAASVAGAGLAQAQGEREAKSSEELNEYERAATRRAEQRGEAIRRFAVPMSTEPAFIFQP